MLEVWVRASLKAAYYGRLQQRGVLIRRKRGERASLLLNAFGAALDEDPRHQKAITANDLRTFETVVREKLSRHASRTLIRQMSMENPLWGAPRIHGELLKLGFEVAQSSVAKYMTKRRGPPSQAWLTLLRNHADVAAMDFFVVPTIGFDLLYAFVIVRLDRRDLVWMSGSTSQGIRRQNGWRVK